MLFKFGIAAILSLTAASVFAKGGGYNGPVTAGESLPVNLDRAVSLDRLSATLRACGDELITDIVRQASKLSPAEFAAQYPLKPSEVARAMPWQFDKQPSYPSLTQVYYWGGGMQEFGDYPNRYSINFTDDHRFSIRQNEGQDAVIGEGEISHRIYNIELTKGDRQVKFQGIELPTATFLAALSEAKYDEFGTVDTSTVILSGLKLVFPKSYQEEIPLVNYDSGIPSALRANAKGYVDCFFNEIAK